MKTEAGLQLYLFRQAKMHQIFCRKMEASGRRGFPDVLLINDRVVFVELKTPAGTGRLSALQKREIDLLRRAGADVRVIDTVEGVDDLIAELT
jgi:hypothetical protein